MVLWRSVCITQLSSKLTAVCQALAAKLAAPVLPAALMAPPSPIIFNRKVDLEESRRSSSASCHKKPLPQAPMAAPRVMSLTVKDPPVATASK